MIFSHQRQANTHNVDIITFIIKTLLDTVELQKSTGNSCDLISNYKFAY